MGAEKLPTEDPLPAQPSKNSISLARGMAALAAVVWLVTRIQITGESEKPQLSPEEQSRLEKRMKEIDDSEQYALVANADGWYACLHSGRTSFFLHSGEVWKYGVTSKGAFGRYTLAFLVRNNVSYIVQFKGNYGECLKQEQIKLFIYPYLPENQARDPVNRLPRPPYNPVMR